MSYRSLIVLIACITLSALVVGCGKAQPETASAPAAEAHDDHAGHDHAAHDDHAGHDHAAHDDHDDHAAHDDHAEHATSGVEEATYGLTLNDGAKWQVDAHTRVTSLALIKLEQNYPAIFTIAEAQVLGKGLDATVNELIKGCTMTGPSHDQLHIFLTALTPQIATLKTARDVETAKAARAEVKSILAAYSRYFE